MGELTKDTDKDEDRSRPWGQDKLRGTTPKIRTEIIAPLSKKLRRKNETDVEQFIYMMTVIQEIHVKTKRRHVNIRSRFQDSSPYRTTLACGKKGTKNAPRVRPPWLARYQTSFYPWSDIAARKWPQKNLFIDRSTHINRGCDTCVQEPYGTHQQ